MPADLAYHAMFQSVSDAIIVLSEDGRALDCNPAALALYRCTREQIIGTTPDNWSPEFQPDGRRSALASAEIIERTMRGEVMRFGWVNQRMDGTLVHVEATVSLIASSDARRFVVVSRDITAQTMAAEALTKRVEILTQPTTGSPVVFEDLFSLETIQRIQDDFAAATGVASLITYPDGRPITAPSNFTALCSDIIRKTERGCANCFKSDAAIGRYHPEGPIVQPCLSGGLWDAGASITLDGRHIANWLIGQVRDETQTDAGMRAYARTIGANETEFMAAFYQVPAMSRERFEKIAQALFTLAKQLSVSAYQNLQQARHIAERKQSEEALAHSEERWKFAVEGAGDGVWDWNIQTGDAVFSKRWKEMIGFADSEIENNASEWSSRVHPEDLPKVMTSLHDHLDGKTLAASVEFRMLCKDASWLWVLGRGMVVSRDADGKPARLVGTNTDISERRAAAEKIEHLAFYDSLTDLPNRRLLGDRLERALTSSARHHRTGALMLLDMDNFKKLNDTMGHDIGDQFLVEVARRLRASIREGDTVARQGGDEFVVILEDLSEEALAPMQAEMIAVKILKAVSEPYVLDLSATGGAGATRRYHCTSSIGIALFQNSTLSVDELMRRADTAMYQAKAAGRNALRFFDPDMQAVVAAHAAMDDDLRTAVLYNHFALHYQAQVDGEGRLTGVEALLRWSHPQRGVVSPTEFIPMAESSGLILPLGNWVLQTACAQLAQWATQPAMAHLTLAVNVSARQLKMPNFVEEVLAVIAHHRANPQRLKLELTESLLVDDVDDVIIKMSDLKAQGVSFSLDDFGTGYSSLSYLKRLPLDQLKIDRSFVRDVLTDPNDATIARTVVALAQTFGLSVIAEGVETEAQRAFLAANGCTAYQGYLFGRPMPVEELIAAWYAEPS